MLLIRFPVREYRVSFRIIMLLFVEVLCRIQAENMVQQFGARGDANAFMCRSLYLT